MTFTTPTYDHMSGRIKTIAQTPHAKDIAAKIRPFINQAFDFKVEISSKGNILTILGTSVELVNCVIQKIKTLYN